MPYVPRESDIIWLRGLVDSLRLGGDWGLPATGVTFRKTGESQLTLISVVADRPEAAFDIIQRTVAVGRAAGVEVLVEGTADTVVVAPGPLPPDVRELLMRLLRRD